MFLRASAIKQLSLTGHHVFRRSLFFIVPKKLKANPFVFLKIADMEKIFA